MSGGDQDGLVGDAGHFHAGKVAREPATRFGSSRARARKERKAARSATRLPRVHVLREQFNASVLVTSPDEAYEAEVLVTGGVWDDAFVEFVTRPR